MLCDIDCRHEVPLTDNESGRDFMQALEGWGKISNNILVWDYGINFDNLVSLCPPWHYGVGHPAWFFVDEVSVR